jgi:hypothetical protein
MFSLLVKDFNLKQRGTTLHNRHWSSYGAKR